MSKTFIIVLFFCLIIFLTGNNNTKTAQKDNLEGLDYYYKGEYKKAILFFEKASKASPENIYYYINQGIVYSDIKDYELAIENYNKAIEISPTTYVSYLYKAKALLENNKKEEALENLLIAYENGIDDALIYIGKSYQDSQEYDKAIINYLKCIDTNKLNSYVYNQLGLCYIKIGDYTNAIKTISEGIKLNDTNTIQQLLFNEIVAYEYTGQFDIALEKVNSYLIKYPQDDKAIRERDFIESRN